MDKGDTSDTRATRGQHTSGYEERELVKPPEEFSKDSSDSFDEFLRTNPPKFDPDTARIWLKDLEEIFDTIECPETKKVSWAAHQLRGSAEQWWKRTESRHQNEAINWEKFKSLFSDMYCLKSISKVELGKDEGESSKNKLKRPYSKINNKDKAQAWVNTKACFVCGKEGHRARNCYQRRNVSMVQSETQVEQQARTSQD